MKSINLLNNNRMAKVKCVNGYPLWDIVDVPLEGDSYHRVHRNLYVSKKGYLVMYWTKEEGLVKQEFLTVDDVRAAYDVSAVKGRYIPRC